MITRDQLRQAVEECIRNACGEPSDQWYAVTVWPHKIDQRCGIGVVTYSEDEYFDVPGCEQTVFVINGIPDIDPCGEWINPDTGELDAEAAIDEIVETELELWEDEEHAGQPCADF